MHDSLRLQSSKERYSLRPLSAIALASAFLTGTAPAIAAQNQAGTDSVRGSADWIIVLEGHLPGKSRPSLGAHFVVRGTQAVIRLDTAVAVAPPPTPGWNPVDSLRLSIGMKEIVTADCGLSPTHLTGLHIAVVADTVDSGSNYPTPRLAWVIDTIRLRLRPVRPSKVHCVEPYEG